MNGILLINKDKGYTSHDVVAVARRKLKTKKIGHVGTLDPNATGLLVLCVNEATKLVPFLENDQKEYYAEVILGIETDTFDITGEIVNQQKVDISAKEIDAVLQKFTGKLSQYPPIYSAIKVNGRKLYEYARKNQEVEISPREIEIFSLKRADDIMIVDDTIHFFINVVVSKGTYIRSLCHDIGVALKTYGTMGNLTRLKSGKFDLNEALTLAELEQKPLEEIELVSCLDALTIPIKVIEVDEELWLRRVKNGMKISLSNLKNYCPELMDDFLPKIAFSSNNVLLAIYEYDEKQQNYKVARIWN